MPENKKQPAKGSPPRKSPADQHQRQVAPSSPLPLQPLGQNASAAAQRVTLPLLRANHPIPHAPSSCLAICAMPSKGLLLSFMLSVLQFEYQPSCLGRITGGTILVPRQSRGWPVADAKYASLEPNVGFFNPYQRSVSVLRLMSVAADASKHAFFTRQLLLLPSLLSPNVFAVIIWAGLSSVPARGPIHLQRRNLHLNVSVSCLQHHMVGGAWAEVSLLCSP